MGRVPGKVLSLPFPRGMGVWPAGEGLGTCDPALRLVGWSAIAQPLIPGRPPHPSLAGAPGERFPALSLGGRTRRGVPRLEGAIRDILEQHFPMTVATFQPVSFRWPSVQLVRPQVLCHDPIYTVFTLGPLAYFGPPQGFS